MGVLKQTALDKLYSRKQQEVLQWHFTHDYYMLVNHGAVRTGKTFVDNDIFLAELRRIGKHAEHRQLVDPQYILAGASLGALQRNVLTPLTQKYGITFHFDKFNRFRLFGTLVCCFGHDDIGNLAAITGMTAYGAYINEGTKANNEVLKQIVKRCSGDREYGARIIIDTNPDSPIHPIKADYIDQADGERIKEFHWELNDNPFLRADWVEDLKRATPSGVFTDRDINGMWVTAEGVVYVDFDKRAHVVQELPAGELFCSYFCGVDWGYEHKGSICLFGELSGGTVVLLKEITTKHKLIDWWVQQARGIVAEYGYGIPFYCDSARPDNIEQFAQSGIWAVGARREICAGIEAVAKRFKTGKLLIYEPGAEEFMKEVYDYVWDEKRGVPIKQNDDVMDAVRYGVYNHDIERRDDVIRSELAEQGKGISAPGRSGTIKNLFR